MIWGAFCYGGVGPICRLNGIVNGARYRELLENNLPDFIDTIGDDAIFQQDNAPIHKSNVVMTFFEQFGINLLSWPAQSPDLNPIEHLWSYVGRQLKKKKYTNLNRLMAEIDAIWKSVPKEYMESLILSMPERCAAVIANKGYATPY
jgi:hypothetical protein